MKKYILFFIGLGVLTAYGNSQEIRFTIRTGAGYYMDFLGMEDGSTFWLEGGYKLNSGFNLNGRFSTATIDWIMNEGYFEGYKTVAIRHMVDLTFSKPIKIKDQHYLEPGVGFKLKKEYSFYPDISSQDDGNGTIYYTRYSSIFYEIGFTLCLDYYYQFESNFYLGLRADSNIIWALGFEGLSVTPLFGFRF